MHSTGAATKILIIRNLLFGSVSADRDRKVNEATIYVNPHLLVSFLIYKSKGTHSKLSDALKASWNQKFLTAL